MEIAPTAALFADPRHPYTRTLLDAVPTLDERPPPSPTYGPSGSDDAGPESPGGCPWFPRCTHPARDAGCRVAVPDPAPPEAGHRVACVKEA